MKILLVIGLVFYAFTISHVCGQKATRGLLATFPSSVIIGETGEFCLRFFGSFDEEVQVLIYDDEPHAFESRNEAISTSKESCLSIKIFNEPSLGDIVKQIKLNVQSSDGTYTFTDKKSFKILSATTLTFIETDKPVYKPLDIVQLRVLTLDHNLKPVTSNFKLIQIQDSTETRVYQWSNIKTTRGLVQLKLPLSDEPNMGNWSAIAEDFLGTLTKVTFEVRKYVLPKFELQLNTPKSLADEVDEFSFTVCAKYPFGKEVKGILNVEFIYRSKFFNPKFSATYLNKTIKGCETISMSVNEIKNGERIGFFEIIQINARFNEDETGQNATAHADIPIRFQKYSIEVIEPKYYKPGLPSKFKIKVKNGDDSLAINTTFILKNDEMSFELTTNDNGLAQFTTTLVESCKNKTCDKPKTIYFNVFKPLKNESIYGFSIRPWFSNKNSYIQIYEKIIGDDEKSCKKRINLIIKQQTPVDFKKNIYFKVTSRSKVILSGYIDENSDDAKMTLGESSMVFLEKISLKSRREINEIDGDYLLSLPLSIQDSNEVKILVFFAIDDEIILDSITIKTKKCLSNEVTLTLDNNEVRTKEQIKLTIQSAPGSLCSISASDKSVSFMGKLNRLSIDQTFDALSQFNLIYDNLNKYKYTDSCKDSIIKHGKRSPMLIVDHHMFDYNTYNAIEALKSSGLIHFTDMIVYNQMRCIMPRMMSMSLSNEDFDGEIDEEFIEMDMVDSNAYTAPTSKVPKLVETIRSHFPETWLWQLEELDEMNGKKELMLQSPDSITDWLFDSYCLSSEKGLGISPQKTLRVFQPFFVIMNLPYSIVQEETFPLKVSVLSYLNECVPIQVEFNEGKNFSIQNETKFNHCLCPDGKINQEFRVKALAFDEKGLNISATARIISDSEVCSSSNELDLIYSDTEIRSLVVYPPGIAKEYSRSSLVVLTSADGSYSDSINFSYPNNVIAGTVKAFISVIGDIMGPALDNLDRLVQLPTGCGEQNMIYFAPLVSLSKYLKATQQFQGSIRSKLKDYITKGYQRELTYRHTDGSYSAFGREDKEGGGTWLSAFVLKSFSQSISSDILSMDKNDIEVTYKWLLKTQSKDGSFAQVGAKLLSKALSGGLDSEQKIGLTAYVMISLYTAVNEAKLNVDERKFEQGLRFLKSSVKDLTGIDTYSLALVFYTLKLANLDMNVALAIEKEIDNRARKDVAYTYWSSSSSSSSSADIEVTSYILLAKLHNLNIKKRASTLQDLITIVKWLVSKQTSLGGYYSTQDTVVALEALSKFASLFYTEKVSMRMDWITNGRIKHSTRIHSQNRLLLQKFRIAPRKMLDNLISFSLNGTGNALVQVSIKYNVIEEKINEAKYELSIESNTSNCKTGLLEFQIKPVSIDFSSMTIVFIRLPSGWTPLEDSIKKIFLLKRHDIKGGETTLYFNSDKMPEKSIAIEMQRDFYVQNSQPGHINVYDYYEPKNSSVLKQFEFFNCN